MPFLTGFGKRKEIRYGTVFPDSNLADFPKLLQIAGDTDVAAELSGGGGIAVTTDDETTEVPFGLYPSSDPTSGDLILRAKFPALLTGASTGDVLGYLYYDAGEATTEDKAGTVDNDYAAFLVPGDYSGNVLEDWASESQYAGSGGLSSSDLVSSPESQALDYDGSDDQVSITAASPLTSLDIIEPKTVELILQHDDSSSGLLIFSLTKDNSSSAGTAFWIEQQQEFALTDFGVYDWGGTRLGTVFMSGGTDIPADTWFSLAFTQATTGSAVAAWINGAAASTFGASATSNPAAAVGVAAVAAGNAAFPTPRFNRPIGTIRVSSVVRDADWFAYQHQDDFNNSDTFTLGAEEAEVGGFVAYPRPRGAYAGMSVMTGGV